MLDQLLNGVLPVFGIGALGYVFGLRRTFDFNMAMALNKFVMFVAMPALGFQLLANAPLAEFNFAMLGGYFLWYSIRSDVQLYMTTDMWCMGTGDVDTVGTSPSLFPISLG